MSSLPNERDPETVRASGRIPPQNLEAEQSVLGAILLDNSAAFTAMEHLKTDEFYFTSHRQVFESMAELAERNQPIDILTLTEHLKKTDRLDAAGGAAYVASLSNAVPSTANIVHYAKIVREKATLRKLIHTASEIIQRGHEPGGDAEVLLDEAERTILEIGQNRGNQGFVELKDALKRTFKVLESLAEKRSAVTGVPTGFNEIDRMTSGLQPGDLVIVAGRPSMGKTAFAINMAENAALHSETPTGVAVFSLEMGTDQLVMRMLTSQGRVDGQKLRTGYASQHDLNSLVKAADKLSRAPIYIDDTAGMTIMEMRAKSRRLQVEKGIGMIVVDYLQLMKGRAGSGREISREQEISEISRGLKALAKELKVPVVALSQLNRSLEARTDKRPMLSDLRECVTGETLVALADGRHVPIRDLVGTTPDVLAMTAERRIVPSASDMVWMVGKKPVFRVVLSSGCTIRATAKHRLYGSDGWVRVGNLREGDRLAVAARVSEPRFELDARAALSVRAPVENDLAWNSVTSVTADGEEDVFDLTVPGPSSWIANSSIVSHNSGALEQDSDVIMFVYRDEVYNKETDERGVAEIIIGKQRNGPVGTAKVRFFHEFTRFENLAIEQDPHHS